MKKDRFQGIMFIIFTVCALVNLILDMLPWFRYTMLLGVLFYLALGWYFPLIRDDNNLLANALAGLIYAMVFLGNFLETGGALAGIIIVYIGYAMAIALMIYMLLKRKTVRKDMIIQSVVLFYIAPAPIFI
jgi:hypothetical protein